MLSTYSVLMMLLLVTGSLIGISSIYQPVNVETQPQQQQPLVAPNQTLLLWPSYIVRNVENIGTSLLTPFGMLLT
jgi:hypothetical protein